MKINWDKKYNTIAVYAFIVVSLSIIFYNVISKLDAFTGKLNEIMGIFQPFVIGFIIAYLLNFILKFYEDKVFKLKGLNKIKKSSMRGLSILISYITAGIIIYVFMHFVLPQLIESVIGLINDIPKYVKELTTMVENQLHHMDINEEYMTIISGKFTEVTNWLLQILTNLLPIIGNAIMSVASSIWNIILGIIISIYLLIDKEKFFALGKKVTTSLFNEKHTAIILDLANRTNLTFGRFIGGKIVDSAIIGVLTFIILTIFKCHMFY